MIEISKIRLDERLQSRAALDQNVVAEYAEAYRANVKMPPVVLFFDGSTHWLADGFHRYNGAKDAGLTQIHEEVIPGTFREAILHSVRANETHGLRRTNADKRKAVQTLLDDAEWATWSSEAVAKACCVSPRTVSAIRHSANAELEQAPAEVTYTTKHGTTATMQTAKIGKKGEAQDHLRETEDAAPKPAAEPECAPKIEEIQEPEPDRTAELEANLRDAIEDNASMGRVFDSNDHLAAAMAEAKRYREENRVLKARVTGLMNEKNAAISSAKSWQRKFDKLEKEIAIAGAAA